MSGPLVTLVKRDTTESQQMANASTVPVASSVIIPVAPQVTDPVAAPVIIPIASLVPSTASAPINYTDIFDVTDLTDEMMKEMNEDLSKIIAESEKIKAATVKPRSDDLDKYIMSKTSRTPPPRRRLYDDEDDDDCFRPSASPMFMRPSTTRIFEDFEEDVKEEGKINEIHDELTNLSSIVHNMLSQMTKNNRIINDKLNKIINEMGSLREDVRAIDKRIDDVQIEMEQYLTQMERNTRAPPHATSHPSHHPGFA